jgi:hypothetical protein
MDGVATDRAAMCTFLPRETTKADMQAWNVVATGTQRNGDVETVDAVG